MFELLFAHMCKLWPIIFLVGEKMFYTVAADKKGNIIDLPDFFMLGRSGDKLTEITGEDVISLPEGAAPIILPERHPIGINKRTGKIEEIRDYSFGNKRKKVYALGAMLPQGFTRSFLPAAARNKFSATLPLYGYTALGFDGKQFVVAAIKTDSHRKWHPDNYNTAELPAFVQRKLKKYPANRILKQLGKCALEYRCYTAQNVFYARWEGGLPVSPVCNAGCLGCISLQESECCPAPQNRIAFVPTVEEVVQVGMDHLDKAKDAIISFGQGCEGEPSMQYKLISEAVRALRGKTNKGTININTNAGYTEGIKAIVQSGIDSMRVSTFSANDDMYNAYYRPKGYNLANVSESIKAAKEKDIFVSLNLLTFPGVNDNEKEAEALIRFIKDTGVDMVQFRNLNIDPDMLLPILPARTGKILGVSGLINILKEQIPTLRIGNYTPALSK